MLPFFPPVARKERVPGDPGFRRNGRVGFRFLAYTFSKNVIAHDPMASFVAQETPKKKMRTEG